MPTHSSHSQQLKSIMDDLVANMEDTTNKVNQFGEQTKNLLIQKELELKEIQESISNHLKEMEQLDIECSEARENLIKISVQTNKTKDFDISYEFFYKQTEKLIALKKRRDKEFKKLFDRRDSLEKELLQCKEWTKETEHIMSTLNVSLRYLKNDVPGINSEIIKKEDSVVELLTRQEANLKKISRDIHDGPTQTIIFILMEIQSLKNKHLGNIDASRAKIEDIEVHIRSALSEMREIIYTLTPMSLEDLGLIPTLQNYIKTYIKPKGLLVTLNLLEDLSPSLVSPPDPCSLYINDKYVKTNLFRIIQECLSNVIKHANATQVSIAIQEKNQVIRLAIKDNGKGFDTKEFFSRNTLLTQNVHYGLCTIKERVSSMNGNYNIQSSDKGTIVSIILKKTNKLL